MSLDRTRLQRIYARAFPRGPVDLIWQVVIVVVAYQAWRYARGAIDGSPADSFANARDLVSIERGLSTFVEADIQSWAIAWQWPADFASWMYSHAHFNGSLLALCLIYVAFNRSFYFVRNMLIAAMAISLAGYALFPTAPPRFFEELGFDEAVAVTGNSSGETGTDPLLNPYAAVPSMHVGFAMIFGWSLALLVRPRALKAALFAYPLLMTFVVVVTGNHWWIDGLFGAMAAALAAGVAFLLARLRPETWSFGEPARPLPESLPESLEPLPEAATV